MAEETCSVSPFCGSFFFLFFFLHTDYFFFLRPLFLSLALFIEFFLRSTIFKPPSPALCTSHCALVCCEDHPPSFCCPNVCRHKSLDYTFFCTLQGQWSVFFNVHLHLGTNSICASRMAALFCTSAVYVNINASCSLSC